MPLGPSTPTISNREGWNPSCCKNIRMFPTQYVANRKAWVIRANLTDYWKALDARTSFRNSTISQFVGQCAAHPHTISYLNNVKEVFWSITATVFSNHLTPLNNHIIHTSPPAICKENYFYGGTQGVSWGNTHARKLLQKQHISS
jgi:hypothetical protein